MRYLAIDLGTRRTGLATGTDVTGPGVTSPGVTNMVSPLSVIEHGPGEALIRSIQEAIDEHGPAMLVLGLPLNMDGTEGEPARQVRTFAAALHMATGLPVAFQDERLTSFAAEQHLNRSGRTHKQKKQRRDALAAAEILRDYLAAGPPPE